MNDFKIIFAHGYTASSKEDWYPNISSELTRLGVNFAIPDLPGGEHPHAQKWLEKIHKIVNETKKPTVFVGHSLGTRTILLYLDKFKKRVKAVFLIAAFANRLENAHKYDGDGYPDFFEYKVNTKEIKKLADKFIVMHSLDDPLHYEQGVEIAKDLGAKLITYKDRRHFSDPENAEFVLDVLRKELPF